MSFFAGNVIDVYEDNKCQLWTPWSMELEGNKIVPCFTQSKEVCAEYCYHSFSMDRIKNRYF
jgi:hypothetical protein